MKKLLVIVDYQKDFIDGSLGFEHASDLESKILERIKVAEESGEEIIFTKDIHDSNYLETEEGKHLPIIHCVKGSEGAELSDGLKKFEKKYKVFEKGAFGSLDLGNYIKNRKYDEITIIGLVSYICVLSNAIICKSALPNAHIVVEKNLTSAQDKKAEEIGFKALENVHIEIR